MLEIRRHQFQRGFYLGLGKKGICEYKASAGVTGSPWASNCGFPLCVGTNTFLQICRLNNLLCWVAMEFYPLRVAQTQKLPKSSLELEYFLCLFSPPTFLQPPLGTTFKFRWCIITWLFPLSVKLLTSPPDLILMKSWPALRREVKQTWKGALWNSASSGSKKLWFSHITILQKNKMKNEEHQPSPVQKV